MIVHPVVMPGKEALSFAVLGDDGSVVELVETYLAYLAALECPPNTQRAYATSLKLWFEFLDRVDLAWDDVGVDNVASFVSWLRSPAYEPRTPRLTPTSPDRSANNARTAELCVEDMSTAQHASSGSPSVQALEITAR